MNDRRSTQPPPFRPSQPDVQMTSSVPPDRFGSERTTMVEGGVSPFHVADILHELEEQAKILRDSEVFSSPARVLFDLIVKRLGIIRTLTAHTPITRAQLHNDIGRFVNALDKLMLRNRSSFPPAEQQAYVRFMQAYTQLE